jgi:hypothetical protein
MIFNLNNTILIKQNKMSETERVEKNGSYLTQYYIILIWYQIVLINIKY